MKLSFKYEVIARTIEDQILSGSLKPGQRLPSVREIRREQNVSASTAFQAYYSLEARGLVEARDRSGYFVSLHPVQQRKFTQARPEIATSYPTATESKDVREIIHEVEQTKLNKDFVILGTATPSIKTLPVEKLRKSFKESVQKHHSQLLEYEDPQGSPDLRKHILVQCMKWGGNFRLEEVTVTAGCLEAINLCLRVLLSEGDRILLDNLNYFNISEIISESKIQAHTFSFSEGPFDAVAFEKTLIDNKIKACLICSNFHNPSGTSISEENKREIVAIAGRNGVFIVEDDVYGDIYFGKSRPGTLKKYDQEGIVFYCSSFSKTLAPGYRIGYCISGTFTSELVRQKRLLSLGTNRITQAALVNFMETGRYDLHLKKLRKQLHLNLLRYGECLIKYFPREVYIQIPEGGYVLWIAFPSSFDGYRFFSLSKEEKIVVVPGQIFSLYGAHKNYIRLSFAEPFDERIEVSLKKLGRIADVVSK